MQNNYPDISSTYPVLNFIHPSMIVENYSLASDFFSISIPLRSTLQPFSSIQPPPLHTSAGRPRSTNKRDKAHRKKGTLNYQHCKDVMNPYQGKIHQVVQQNIQQLLQMKLCNQILLLMLYQV